MYIHDMPTVQYIDDMLIYVPYSDVFTSIFFFQSLSLHFTSKLIYYLRTHCFMLVYPLNVQLIMWTTASFDPSKTFF